MDTRSSVDLFISISLTKNRASIRYDVGRLDLNGAKIRPTAGNWAFQEAELAI
jgi:hypothetical protein